MYHVVRRVFVPRCVLRIGLLLIAAGAIPSGAAGAQQVTVPATSPSPPSPQQIVTCTSKTGERQVCAADTAAGVALLRSTGAASCLLGKTWGYDDKGIWVFDGCGGEFALGSTHEASEGKRVHRHVRALRPVAHSPGRRSTTPRRCRTTPLASASISGPAAPSRCSSARSGA